MTAHPVEGETFQKFCLWEKSRSKNSLTAPDPLAAAVAAALVPGLQAVLQVLDHLQAHQAAQTLILILHDQATLRKTTRRRSIVYCSYQKTIFAHIKILFRNSVSDKPKVSDAKTGDDKNKGGKRNDKEKNKENRRSRSTSPRRRRRERSPTPKSLRIHIGCLTRNISRDHLLEIFSVYGTVKTVEIPTVRNHNHLHRGFAYIEFSTADEAENAMKHMDGGQIDGQEITAAPVLIPKHPPQPRRNSPIRRPPQRWMGRSPPKYYIEKTFFVITNLQ